MPKRKNIPFKLRKKIYDKYNGFCCLCGDKTTLFKPENALLQKASVIDHIHPVKFGGTNDESNLQLLCISCNARKFDKVGEEWMGVAI